MTPLDGDTMATGVTGTTCDRCVGRLAAVGEKKPKPTAAWLLRGEGWKTYCGNLLGGCDGEENGSTVCARGMKPPSSTMVTGCVP